MERSVKEFGWLKNCMTILWCSARFTVSEPPRANRSIMDARRLDIHYTPLNNASISNANSLPYIGPKTTSHKLLDQSQAARIYRKMLHTPPFCVFLGLFAYLAYLGLMRCKIIILSNECIPQRVLVRIPPHTSHLKHIFFSRHERWVPPPFWIENRESLGSFRF